MDEKDLTFSIAKLELSPGDILVVKGGPTPHNDYWHRFLPPGVRVLIVPPDVELSVLTKAEIDARAA
jgi:hypothetical protein